MKRAGEWKKAVEFCQRYGLKAVRYRRGRYRFMWDGKSQTLRGDDASGVFHELAHYLISTPRRRKLPEFGTGPGPLSTTTGFYLAKAAEVRRSKNDRNLEEPAASLLGILFEIRLGLDYETTMIDHNWGTEEGPEDAVEYLKKRRKFPKGFEAELKIFTETHVRMWREWNDELNQRSV